MTGGDGGQGLRGLAVALVGRLASMDRKTARERLRRAGARVVAQAEKADLVVVGDGVPRPAGSGVEVLDEATLLQRLGLGPERGPLYTTARLAALLGLPAARIRAWVRQDLLRPAQTVGRLDLFDFRGVASARQLARLGGQGLGPRRIRRSLERARRWLAEGAGPELLETGAGGRPAVRLEDGRLADPDGQLLLDFGDGGRGAGDIPAPTPRVGPDAETWFGRGVAAEAAGQLEEAVSAYRRALELLPEAETFFNLGNCLWALARPADAAAAYRQAVAADPEFAEAWNNLGNALAELGDAEGAVQAYRRALAVVPHYADAHYNLASTLDGLGRRGPARDHWRAFLVHDPNNPAAAEARSRLQEADA